jgi:hypothetical protein
MAKTILRLGAQVVAALERDVDVRRDRVGAEERARIGA